MSESESNLVAHLGVYGIWLLKHARKLPKDDSTSQLKTAYKAYWELQDHRNTKALIDEIDRFCASSGWEPPRDGYEKALKEYNELEYA